jgi:hypothetical protein
MQEVGQRRSSCRGRIASGTAIERRGARREFLIKNSAPATPARTLGNGKSPLETL